MKIVIAGGSYEAEYIIKMFHSHKNDLIVINPSKEEAEILIKREHVAVYVGSPWRYFVLDEANAHDADVFIALCEKDADNYASCLLAKKCFGAKKCICVVNNPLNVNLYKDLGIDSVVSSTYLLGQTIKSESSMEELIKTLSIENDRICMLKVYLVDDEVLIIEELKRLIDWNKYGFEVVGSSTNSKTAFVDISKMKPALVISDINMPLMNGLTLFEKVKEVNPLINFCYLSAYDNFEYVQEALKLGAISYLKKPIIIDDLVALLENILKNFDAEFSSKLFDASISRQYYEKDPYIQSLFENNSFIGSSGTYRIVTFSNFGENKVDLLRVFPAGYYPIYNDKKMLIVLSYGCDLSYLTTLSANLDLAIGVSEEFSNFEKVSKHLRFSRIASYQSFISKKNESTLVVDNPKLPVLLGEINEATNVYELQMALSKLEEKILAYDIKVYDLQSIYRISMVSRKTI